MSHLSNKPIKYYTISFIILFTIFYYLLLLFITHKYFYLEQKDLKQEIYRKIQLFEH